MQIEVIDDASPAPAEDALPVGIIHHRERAHFFGRLDDFVQRGYVAIH